MPSYNVEAIMAPVVNDEWDQLRDLIDVIPGTILVEDPDAPLLVFPVDDVEDGDKAFDLVNGYLTLRGVQPLKGRICLDIEDDCGSRKSDWEQLVSSC